MPAPVAPAKGFDVGELAPNNTICAYPDDGPLCVDSLWTVAYPSQQSSGGTQFASLPSFTRRKGEAVMPARRLIKARKAGRPPTLTVPESISDAPENVATGVLYWPSKMQEWKFIQQEKSDYNWPSHTNGRADL